MVAPGIDAWGYKSVWVGYVSRKIDTSALDICTLLQPKMNPGCTFEGNTKYLFDMDLEIPADTVTGNLEAELYVKDRSNDETINCFRVYLNLYT